MPTRTVSNAGGNYNSVGTWVEGAVPTSADDVVFTATSGNLTVNVTSDAKSINFTNYVGTLTISASFRVFGNINLGTGGYTVTGTNSLNVFDTSTINSNGVSFQGNFAFSGSNKTYTLADDLNVLGVLSLNGIGTYTCNGFSIYCNSSLQVLTTGTFTGTSNIIFNGTGTWVHSSTGIINNNITINTAGIITCGTNVRYSLGTLTYISGTVVTTGSTLNISGTCTLNTSGMTWNNIQPIGNTTLTLSSDLNVGGNLSLPTQVTFTINGFNINLKGNLNLSNGLGTAGLLTGTTVIKFNGTSPQTWSSPSTTNTVTNNLIFLNDVTISGQVYFRTGTITYTSGTITTTGSTLQLLGGATTLNTAGIIWNNVVCNGATTRTLSSTLTCNSLSVINGNNTFDGSSGFVTNNFSIAAGLTVTFVNGVTYTVNTSLISSGTVGSQVTFNCASGSALFNLTPGATQSLTYTNATRINSAGGQTINTNAGTLILTINWNVVGGNFFLLF